MTYPGLYLLVLNYSNINSTNAIIDTSAVVDFTCIMRGWSQGVGTINYIGYLNKISNTSANYKITVNPSGNNSGTCTLSQNCWRIS